MGCIAGEKWWSGFGRCAVTDQELERGSLRDLRLMIAGILLVSLGLWVLQGRCNADDSRKIATVGLLA